MFKTQERVIIEELRKKKKVSRNWALNRRITRLGAHIKDLCNAGWKFDDRPAPKCMMHGKYENKSWEWDYVYYLVSEPKKKRK